MTVGPYLFSLSVDQSCDKKVAPLPRSACHSSSEELSLLGNHRVGDVGVGGGCRGSGVDGGRWALGLLAHILVPPSLCVPDCQWQRGGQGSLFLQEERHLAQPHPARRQACK